jgi:ribonuclease-3
MDSHEEYEINIYNPNNRLFKKDDLITIFEKSGVDYSNIAKRIHENKFDLKIFQMAFSHKSYCVNCIKLTDEMREEGKHWNPPLQQQSYERIEFLGDSVVDLIIGEYLYERYPREQEGFLTILRTKLVRNRTIGLIAKYLGLMDFLLISKFTEDRCNGRTNVELGGNVFESFIGACYKNFGYDFCNDFVLGLIENIDIIDISEFICNDDNYKDQLLQKSHILFQGRDPVYKQISAEGLSNNRIFTMGVFLPYTEGQEPILVATSQGRKKKDAEQECAKIALKKLTMDGLL